MMNATDIVTDFELLESLDWHPCESPNHHTDAAHEGDGFYIVVFRHPCIQSAGMPTVRCKRLVEHNLSLRDPVCPTCHEHVPRDEVLVVIGLVKP